MDGTFNIVNHIGRGMRCTNWNVTYITVNLTLRIHESNMVLSNTKLKPKTVDNYIIIHTIFIIFNIEPWIFMVKL